MKSGNINFLEPSGPLQACNGTAFYYTIILHIQTNILLEILFLNVFYFYIEILYATEFVKKGLLYLLLTYEHLPYVRLILVYLKMVLA